SDLCKCCDVSGRMRPPQIVAAVKMSQLDRKACTLNRIHPTIPADHGMMVFAGLAVVAQHANLVGQLEVICDDGACFTKRAKVFPRIKTEAANFAHRPSSSILVFGTVRLGGIFDYDQAMLAGKL